MEINTRIDTAPCGCPDSFWDFGGMACRKCGKSLELVVNEGRAARARADRGLPPRWEPTDDDMLVATINGCEVWLRPLGVQEPAVILRKGDADIEISAMLSVVLAQAIRTAGRRVGAE